MNEPEKQMPLDMYTSPILQISLKQLNSAFVDFTEAETALVEAEREGNCTKMRKAWLAKSSASERYISEWDILILYGDLQFDDEAGIFAFASDTAGFYESDHGGRQYKHLRLWDLY